MVSSRRHSKTDMAGKDTLESRDNGVILQKLLQDSATWWDKSSTAARMRV